MKSILTLFFIVLLLCASPVFACQKGEAKVFSCTTTKGKYVEVCSAKDTATYSFGRQGQKPEMFLRQSKRTLKYQLSTGSGFASEYLTFRNGNTTYQIDYGTAYERDYSDSHQKGGNYASVNVDVSDRFVASIECRAGTLHEDFNALNMKWEML